MTSLPKHHVNAPRPTGPDLHLPAYWVRDRAALGVIKIWGGAPPGPAMTWDAAHKLKETVVGQRKSRTARVELRPATPEALDTWYAAVQTALGGGRLTIEAAAGVSMTPTPPKHAPPANTWTDETRQAAALAAARAAVPQPQVAQVNTLEFQHVAAPAPDVAIGGSPPTAEAEPGPVQDDVFGIGADAFTLGDDEIEAMEVEATKLAALDPDSEAAIKRSAAAQPLGTVIEAAWAVRQNHLATGGAPDAWREEVTSALTQTGFTPALIVEAIAAVDALRVATLLLPSAGNPASLFGDPNVGDVVQSIASGGALPEAVLDGSVSARGSDLTPERLSAAADASLIDQTLPGASDADLAELMVEDDLDDLIDTANAQADSDHPKSAS